MVVDRLHGCRQVVWLLAGFMAVDRLYGHRQVDKVAEIQHKVLELLLSVLKISTISSAV